MRANLNPALEVDLWCTASREDPISDDETVTKMGNRILMGVRVALM